MNETAANQAQGKMESIRASVAERFPDARVEFMWRRGHLVVAIHDGDVVHLMRAGDGERPKTA
jgi:hypothetical protein